MYGELRSSSGQCIQPLLAQQGDICVSRGRELAVNIQIENPSRGVAAPEFGKPKPSGGTLCGLQDRSLHCAAALPPQFAQKPRNLGTPAPRLAIDPSRDRGLTPTANTNPAASRLEKTVLARSTLLVRKITFASDWCHRGLGNLRRTLSTTLRLEYPRR